RRRRADDRAAVGRHIAVATTFSPASPRTRLAIPVVATYLTTSSLMDSISANRFRVVGRHHHADDVGIDGAFRPVGFRRIGRAGDCREDRPLSGRSDPDIVGKGLPTYGLRCLLFGAAAMAGDG